MGNDNDFYTIDGINYPRVTSILALKDKSGPLMGWAVNMTVEDVEKKFNLLLVEKKSLTKEVIETILKEAKKAYRQKQATALDVGSKTHNGIEVYTKAKSPEEGLRLVQALVEYQEIEKPFGAFLKWHKKVGFELIMGEHQVHSKKYRYAGTLDAIAKVNEKFTLADYKSSTGMCEEYLWQIAAYDQAYREMGGEAIENWGCLRLDKKTGEPEWKEWGAKDIRSAFQKFQCLLDLWWLENGQI